MDHPSRNFRGPSPKIFHVRTSANLGVPVLSTESQANTVRLQLGQMWHTHGDSKKRVSRTFHRNAKFFDCMLLLLLLRHFPEWIPDLRGLPLSKNKNLQVTPSYSKLTWKRCEISYHPTQRRQRAATTTNPQHGRCKPVRINPRAMLVLRQNLEYLQDNPTFRSVSHTTIKPNRTNAPGKSRKTTLHSMSRPNGTCTTSTPPRRLQTPVSTQYGPSTSSTHQYFPRILQASSHKAGQSQNISTRLQNTTINTIALSGTPPIINTQQKNAPCTWPPQHSASTLTASY